MKTSEKIDQAREAVRTSLPMIEILKPLREAHAEVVEMEKKLALIGDLLEDNERSHGPLEGFAAEIDCALTGDDYCEECSRSKEECQCEPEEDQNHD